MAGATSGVDGQQGPSEISSHSEGRYNEKNIQDLLLQLVALTASKMKEPQPPVEGIGTGLRKVGRDSVWFDNLVGRCNNCKALLGLLEANPCLVVQTLGDGFTVLHAAARHGCIQLAAELYDLFKPTGKFVDEQSGINITWRELVNAKHGDNEARAVDYALHTSPRLFKFLKEPGLWYMSSANMIHKDNFTTTNPIHSSSSDANMHLVEIMQKESTKEIFKRFEKDYDQKVKFGDECEELRFHYAAERYSPHREKYVVDVITKCLQLGKPRSAEVLTYLFQLRNMAGQTPLHLVLKYWAVWAFICKLETVMSLFPKKDDDYKNCFNAADVKGWTTLHHAAATGNHNPLEVLLKDERVDVNIRTSEHVTEFERDASTIKEHLSWGKTALHLAILHDDVESVKLLLNCSRMDVNALLKRKIVCGYRMLEESDNYWSPLQLAAIMGSSNIVRILLESPKLEDIFDDGKFSNDIDLPDKDFWRISALLLASASGNPDTLRLFLDNPKFNPLVKFKEATALHYASDPRIPYSIFSYFEKRPILVSNGQLNFFLSENDFAHVSEDFKLERIENSVIEKKVMSTSYLANKACVAMLLQAGVDIWDKDDRGRFAEPGPEATQEARLWWYDRIAQETSEAKKSLNDASNAISVVAALVATASFVGPLQPPLGYGEDTNLSVRVFMVSNNFSFYLAIASIMFAVAPSLPMPQEGIYAEWQRARRGVGMALSFLLMSVLGVLISFAAASNSIVSEEYSWKHGGLSFYPALIGGLICMISISLFFLRLLRLVFNKNEKVRLLYKTFVKI